jgi:aromatic-L-amino-acid decarboxylase
MSTYDLEQQIQVDINSGLIPLLAVATVGTTGTTAVDPVSDMADICQRYSMWLHVDAAWAGTALILPEYRWMIKGLELADSFVFNPHKWMFTNFDCSAYFIKDHNILTRTFALIPEYLKTKTSGVHNYSEWGIQLGRRFRALKLWFVLRNFGVEGLKNKVANHISWARELAEKIDQHPDFQLMQPAPLSCICFRYTPQGLDGDQLNQLNHKLLSNINAGGKLYLTHTKLNNTFVIRLVIGQTYQTKENIDKAWKVIQDVSQSVIAS